MTLRNTSKITTLARQNFGKKLRLNLDTLGTREMAAREEENQRLRQENEHLRKQEHETSTGVKLLGFFCACGICYALEPHSQIAATFIGITAFYFCFMR